MILFDLCDNETYEAFRTPSGEDDWAQYVLHSPGFEDMGPGIADIVAHAEGGEFGTNFQYKLVLQTKWRNAAWTDAGTLISTNTSATYKIGDAFTDRTKLGMKLRVVLRTGLSSGSTIVRGSLSVAIAVRLQST